MKAKFLAAYLAAFSSISYSYKFEDYVCPDILPIYNELITLYCHGDQTKKIEEECARFYSNESICVADEENQNIITLSKGILKVKVSNTTSHEEYGFIHSSNEGIEELEQQQEVEVEINGARKVLSVPENSTAESHQVIEQTPLNVEEYNQKEITLKCMNDINNVSRCTFLSYDLSRGSYSDLNSMKEQALRKELLNRIENQFSKL